MNKREMGVFLFLFHKIESVIYIWYQFLMNARVNPLK